MDVFLSWSGNRSGAVAKALSGWLPGVIQAIRPWTSNSSLDAGVRWSPELTAALEKTNIGILCLTRDNLEAPWILFEAGSLAKIVGKAKTIPYLLDFESRELTGPLSQFQAVTAMKEGTLELMKSLNQTLGGSALPEAKLEEAFRVWWPFLEPKIEEVRKQTLEKAGPPPRKTDDILNEILHLVRSLATTIQSPQVQPAKAVPLEVGLGMWSFGKVLQFYRQQNGMTWKDLAKKTFIPAAVLAAIELDEHTPTLEEAERIANALGIKASDLRSFAGHAAEFRKLLESLDEAPNKPPDTPKVDS